MNTVIRGEVLGIADDGGCLIAYGTSRMSIPWECAGGAEVGRLVTLTYTPKPSCPTCGQQVKGDWTVTELRELRPEGDRNYFSQAR